MMIRGLKAPGSGGALAGAADPLFSPVSIARDRWGWRVRSAALLISIGLGLSACKLTGDDLGVAAVRPVVFPRLSAQITRTTIFTYYRGVLAQMQAAAAGRDPMQLEQLIESHDRDSAPKWFRARLADFTLHLPAVEFEAHAANRASIHLVDPNAPLGASLQYLFTIPPRDQVRVVMHAGDDLDSARFLASIRIEDLDSYGNRSSWRTSRLLELPERLELTDGSSLQLLIELPALASQAAYRKVTLSVEWMPGYLQIDGQRLANGRVQCAQIESLVFPDGVASIRRAPLTTLRNALQLADAAHFNHIYLAAYFMPEDLQMPAHGMLIQTLRLARADLARVCMAALAVAADADISIGDRLGWLRWWQER